MAWSDWNILSQALFHFSHPVIQTNSPRWDWADSVSSTCFSVHSIMMCCLSTGRKYAEDMTLPATLDGSTSYKLQTTASLPADSAYSQRSPESYSEHFMQYSTHYRALLFFVKGFAGPSRLHWRNKNCAGLHLLAHFFLTCWAVSCLCASSLQLCKLVGSKRVSLLDYCLYIVDGWINLIQEKIR